MKKILLFTSVFALIFMVTGCNGKDKVNNENINTATNNKLQNEEQLSNESVSNNDIVFNNIKTDLNNPIDKALSPLMDAADTTVKINKASEEFYNAWKSEMEYAANICKQNKVPQYSDNEYASIEQEIKKAYDLELTSSGAGSSAAGSAMYKAGELYKQGAYYYIALYKQHTGQEYTYLYK